MCISKSVVFGLLLFSLATACEEGSGKDGNSDDGESDNENSDDGDSDDGNSDDEDSDDGDTNDEGGDEGEGTLTWVAIPGGTFDMGNAEGLDDQQPVHAVTVPDFEMLRTEVTVAEYRACAADGGCEEPLACVDFGSTYEIPDSDALPVTCVSWDQSVDFCEWADAGAGGVMAATGSASAPAAGDLVSPQATASNAIHGSNLETVARYLIAVHPLVGDCPASAVRSTSLPAPCAYRRRPSAPTLL